MGITSKFECRMGDRDTLVKRPTEEGVYCFAHVGQSVGRSVGLSTRWFPDDNSRTPKPRIMKLHRYIDHDSQMTPIDFQVTSMRRPNRVFTWRIAVALGIDPRKDAESVLTSRTFAE
ncbi:hypothetical protein DPMN_002270 [Dreissena polymorpha]|uniref:Uncharacterized protein n=1 Tax=Dreissena polymorpha TaxID=45954 RepID=A0A9D4MLN7_DREPO|nr:hypothetical protein DPMN_002270 [Dreissena polymorpha]